MKSKVREEVRRMQQREEAGLTPAERVRRSLEIGARELRFYMSANRCSESEARRRLAENVRRARERAWARRSR